MATRRRLKVALVAFRDELDAEMTDLDAKAEALGADQGLRRFHGLKDLHGLVRELEGRRSERRRLARRLDETERLASALKALNSDVDRAEAELASRLLKVLEDDTVRIFQTITGSGSLRPTLRNSVRAGIRHADIMIEDFHGRGEVRARDYLSEANRNTLGLSLYFAGLLRVDPGLKVLVMDDITHSADNVHRRGLARFLAEEMSQRMQFVLLTHDERWFDQICAGLPDQGVKRLRVVDWSLDGLQLREEST